MNTEQFKQAIETLDDQALQAILDGHALKVEDDETLTIGRPNDAYVIYYLGDEQFDLIDTLKQSLLDRAEALVKDYYQFNPMSKTSFNRQLNALLQAHPTDYFVSMPGQPESGRIFVEEDTLVVEEKGSPRFKYGMALELSEKMTEQAISNKVKNWVSSGHAYQDYISINVCRFSCID
ncbi:hypothetical protein [Galenea microaerophila]